MVVLILQVPLPSLVSSSFFFLVFAQTVYYYFYYYYIEYSNYNSNVLWLLQQHVSTSECHIQVFRDVMSFSLFEHRTDMVLMCFTFAEYMCVECETTVHVLERSSWLCGLQNCVQGNAN